MTTQQILQGVHDWTNGKIVYDISVAHPDGQGNPTKYATLADALGTNGANVPKGIRKGGMSVKFIQSSDNNYVKFFCMAQNFTTDVTQWQGVDEEITAGSHNLVESGGVYKKTFDIITNEYVLNAAIDNNYVKHDGVVVQNDDFAISETIEMPAFSTITFKVRSYLTNVAVLSIYDESQNKYTPLVRSKSSALTSYAYTNNNSLPILVRICYYKRTDLKPVLITNNVTAESVVYIYNKVSNNTSRLDELDSAGEPQALSLSLTTGYYVDANGVAIALATGRISAPIQVHAGDIITATGYAGNKLSMISTTDSEGSSYTPKAKASSSYAVQTVTYTVEEDGYVALSALKDSTSRPELTGTIKTPGKIERIDNHLNTIDNSLNELDGRIDNINSELEAGNILSAFDNIVCVGDSLTYSQVYTGATSSRQAHRPYPIVLSSICGNEPTIIAKAGATTKYIWDNYNENIIEKSNAIGIIYLGTNGGLTDTLDTDVIGDNPDNWSDNNIGCYCRIVNKMKGLGYKVLLIKVWTTGGNLQQTNNAIIHIAERFNCAVINVPVSNNVKYHYYPNLTGSNSVHYNDLGYAWFASKVIEYTGKLNDEQMKFLIPD